MSLRSCLLGLLLSLLAPFLPAQAATEAVLPPELVVLRQALREDLPASGGYLLWWGNGCPPCLEETLRRKGMEDLQGIILLTPGSTPPKAFLKALEEFPGEIRHDPHLHFLHRSGLLNVPCRLLFHPDGTWTQAPNLSPKEAP